MPVLGDDDRPGTLRQAWMVIAMAVALVVLGLGVLLDLAPAATRTRSDVPQQTSTAVADARVMPASSTATVAAPASRPTTTIPLTASPQPSSTRSPQATVTVSMPTARPSPTQTKPVPTFSATATWPVSTTAALPKADHLWLARPIGPDGTDTPSRFYAYASRGDGTYPIHHGVEFVNPLGTPVRAVAPGRIVVAGDDARQVYGARNGFYGLLVIEELDERLDGKPVFVVFGHLSEVRAQVDQRVETGDIIGLVGMTGVAEGPHLHLEVRVGRNEYGATVNPELWFAPKPGKGVLAGVVRSPDGRPVTDEVQVTVSSAADANRVVYSVATYPAREVNPDPSWGESFAIGDVPAGTWRVQVYRGQRLYTVEVHVVEGQTAWAEIQTAS